MTRQPVPQIVKEAQRLVKPLGGQVIREEVGGNAEWVQWIVVVRRAMVTIRPDRSEPYLVTGCDRGRDGTYTDLRTALYKAGA